LRKYRASTCTHVRRSKCKINHLHSPGFSQ